MAQSSVKNDQQDVSGPMIGSRDILLIVVYGSEQRKERSARCLWTQSWRDRVHFGHWRTRSNALNMKSLLLKTFRKRAESSKSTRRRCTIVRDRRRGVAQLGRSHDSAVRTRATR